MRYIITESKLESVIIESLNEIFDINKMSSQHPLKYDEFGNEFEDVSRFQFLIENNGDEKDCFRWHGCKYFSPNTPARDLCPIVVIEDEYLQSLNGFFGNNWIEPFKKWFKENFGLSVKTIEWW